ncbi:FHF complex subunit HOOK-interacting protein 2B isoform X2 [Hyla sarda]|uniref:FHF complex subunit HOOK-interacting protein 2B isoform X2 n=1 Tax=Hyla sarda TaxID=327740 RepID=UPI0024C38EAF|nr:FHF complex subunit HOOK-interacting protein 2B isoform X2 [Hyla sarda]
MWSRLGALLQQVVETREPSQDLLQSFIQHWKGVTQYYLETTDESCPARNTDIPWRLRQLLDILVFEENGCGTREDPEGTNSGPVDNTGPCMEYLLQHKILETLCTLAKAEYPPGMRQQVLVFFSRLLSKVQRPLLHYINVHRPVQKLIALGGDTVGVTAHKEELQFLISICTKLEKDPSLLCHVLETQTGRLAVRAREALLGVLRAAQQEGRARLIAQSDLSKQVVQRLCELHHEIPLSTHPCDITAADGTDWRAEVSSEEYNAMPPEVSAVRRFLCWVEYCNCLLKESHEVIAETIADSIAERYLRGILQEELLHVSELRILRSTALLSAVLQRLNPSALTHRLLSFLLGVDRGPEKRNTSEPQLRTQLIQRCNHLSDEISLTTLRLFEEILQFPEEICMYSLVLRNLESRGYLSAVHEESRGQDSEAFEGTDELEEDPYFTDGFPDTGLRLNNGNKDRSTESSGTEQNVRSFLSLVPEEMKSSDSGFDTYLQDALVQYRGCCQHASSWGWPTSSQPLSTSHSGQEEFYEGLFLQVLLDRLGSILDQPYEMNLQVTSLLTRIALFPHPHIQEYLLNPFINLAPGARTLFSVLVRVVADLAQRSQRVSDFREMLLLIRRQLTGETPVEPLGHETLCKGVVVLEEFCKELAAAACVTHHPLAF